MTDINMELLLHKITDKGDHENLPSNSSAVVIPLIERDGTPHILFEERSHALSFQPGEVCFPGGRIEKGESPRDAAIRECLEELYPDDKKNASGKFDIISSFTPLMGPTGSIVYPYIGLIKEYDFTYSRDEVEQVFTYSIDYLLSHPPVSYPMRKETIAPDNFPYDLIPGGQSYRFHTMHYDMWIYKDTSPVIWGFTGRLLHSFLKSVFQK